MENNSSKTAKQHCTSDKFSRWRWPSL